ncbi:MAG: hypothetical protein MI802_07140 [Desulfobacterales bacterium]|nr:hypothetical protein [Desulfobacterales bacterium]
MGKMSQMVDMAGLKGSASRTFPFAGITNLTPEANGRGTVENTRDMLPELQHLILKWYGREFSGFEYTSLTC